MAALSTPEWWTALKTRVQDPRSRITISDWPHPASARTTTNLTLTCLRGDHQLIRLATTLAVNLDKNNGIFSCHECNQREGTIRATHADTARYLSPVVNGPQPGEWMEVDPITNQRRRRLAEPFERYYICEATATHKMHIARTEGGRQLKGEVMPDHTVRYVLNTTPVPPQTVGKKVRVTAHQLSLLLFGDSSGPRKYAVDHVDHDRTNNQGSNLVYATSAENGRKRPELVPRVLPEVSDEKVPNQRWVPITLPGGSQVDVGDHGWFRLVSGYTRGYLQVTGYYTFNMLSVARLVCSAFNGEPPSASHVVDHINREKGDNRAINLRWATHAENNINRRAGKAVVQLITSQQPSAQLWTKAIATTPLGSVAWDRGESAAVAIYPSAVVAAAAVSRSDSAINLAVARGTLCVGCTWVFADPTGQLRGVVPETWIRPGLVTTDLTHTAASTWIQVDSVDAHGHVCGSQFFIPSTSTASLVFRCNERVVSEVLSWPDGGTFHRRWWMRRFRQARVASGVVVVRTIDEFNAVVDNTPAITLTALEAVKLELSRKYNDGAPLSVSLGSSLRLTDFFVSEKRVRFYEVKRGFNIAFTVPGRDRYLSAMHSDLVDVVCVALPEWAPGHHYWMPMQWFLDNVPERTVVDTQVAALKIAPPGHSDSETQWALQWWDKEADVLG